MAAHVQAEGRTAELDHRKHRRAGHILQNPRQSAADEELAHLAHHVGIALADTIAATAVRRELLAWRRSVNRRETLHMPGSQPRPLPVALCSDEVKRVI